MFNWQFAIKQHMVFNTQRMVFKVFDFARKAYFEIGLHEITVASSIQLYKLAQYGVFKIEIIVRAIVVMSLLRSIKFQTVQNPSVSQYLSIRAPLMTQINYENVLSNLVHFARRWSKKKFTSKAHRSACCYSENWKSISLLNTCKWAENILIFSVFNNNWSPGVGPSSLATTISMENSLIGNGSNPKKRKTNEKLCETIGYTPSALDTEGGRLGKFTSSESLRRAKKRSFRCLPSMGIKLIRLLKLIAARRRSRIRQKVHFNWIPNLGKLNWTRPSAWKNGPYVNWFGRAFYVTEECFV